jgi:toxin ParE1/3/4
MKLRLTRQADADLAAIARDTIRLFGVNQALRYRDIIKEGLAMLSREPDRPATQGRSELGLNIRSFHLQHAARRRSGAAHIVYFVTDAEKEEIVVLRVLHEAMEPKRRLTSALALKE